MILEEPRLIRRGYIAVAGSLLDYYGSINSGSEGAMKTISMLEFRRHSERVIKGALAGERMLLTYRGKPLFHLEPCVHSKNSFGEDPFYRLADHADGAAKPLSNREIDTLLYEN